MRQFKLLSLAAMAVLSFTSAIVASAAAEATLPSLLPEGVGPLLATSKCGASFFGGKVKGVVESSKCVGQISSTSTKKGTFNISFENTKTPLGNACTGLSDAESGLVLMSGTYHIRDYKNGAKELKTAILYLLKTVHFSCITNLVVIRGCVAGALAPENMLTKTLTATLSTGNGDNNIIKVLNEGNTAEEDCELTASENGGAFSLTALETTQELAEFKITGALEALVMRL
jgi:hypothetical protein